jgi:hypothetical protein
MSDAPIPVPADWKHCWWTVIRSTLPADTVAARYRRAFVIAGLPNIRWVRSADTIWVRAGPAPVPTSQFAFDSVSRGATFWVRAVVFAHGDSTHFRLFVATVPAIGGRQTTDSTRGTDWTFPACEASARAADVRWIKRAGDPGDEEKLPVWSRVP